MADPEPSSVRQRKPTAADDEPVQPRSRKAKRKISSEDAYSPYLDILRVLTFLLLASCGLSYLISSGESYFWGMKNPPKYLQKSWWEMQIRGPLYLTTEELAAFDGTDPTRPIYLAINGTIYDVSSNARTYGPGGPYHFFAGTDASRAYVTGCFAEDRTADMRGVEEMFLPIEDPQWDGQYWAAEELKEMRKKEWEDARRKVEEALRHWVDFFAKGKKYNKVGYVKRESGWLKNSPRRELCKATQEGRTRRKAPEGKEEGK